MVTRQKGELIIICRNPEVERNLTCLRSLPTKQNQKGQCNWREVSGGDSENLDKVVTGQVKWGFILEVVGMQKEFS